LDTSQPCQGRERRHLNPFNRKRKPPVAYWSGVVDVGRDGRDLRYTVPDYFNGRLRIVAIAASAHRMGVAEARSSQPNIYSGSAS